MREEFVSENIQPLIATCDTQSLSAGRPGLPREFIWRGQKVIVTRILRTWRSTGPCRHGSGEQYARRQWFEIQTAAHGTMKIYFNRSTLGRTKEMGWWLYTRSK
ncbi:MAG: cytoplasmic protein [Candidatus Omnitrophica bacterium]|nr:cytoplasmic protein [Candidatus Omnitrophota bacterium]MDE2223524.1 cytoplasmic protein [Candidatus Omnitrophota bacterium]